LQNQQEEPVSQQFTGAAETRKAMLERYGGVNPELNDLKAEIENLKIERSTYNVGTKERRAVTDRIATANERIRTVIEQRASEARKMLYVSDPSSVQFADAGKRKMSKAAAQQARDGLGIFNQMVSRKLTEGLSAQFSETSAQRAFFSYGTVSISKASNMTTVVHELGHWLEYNNKELFALVNEFFNRRVAGDRLKWLGGNYPKSEKSFFDDFIEPYMGKLYGTMENKQGTEITSMGLQFFYEDPVRLADEDPDYFDFIYNLLRGE
jgi:hypothetical protein